MYEIQRTLSFCALAVLGVSLSAASAAAQKFIQQPTSCVAPVRQPGCGCNQPSCPTCCKPPCQPPTPPDNPTSELMNAPVESGMYVAPPLGGATRGASNNVGMNWGSITIPELRLRLPSLELPSFFHGRSSAKMVYEGGEAQWQSTGYANAYAAQNEGLLRQQVAALQDQLQKTQPASQQSQAEAAAAKQSAEQYQASMQEELNRLRCEVNRLRALEECLQRSQQEAQRNADCNRGGKPATAPPASHEQVPPTPVPDGAGLRYYPTRPASFDAGVHLVPVPASQVIREPGPPPVPQARITGLRPR